MGVQQLAVANGPNIFQMLLVVIVLSHFMQLLAVVSVTAASAVYTVVCYKSVSAKMAKRRINQMITHDSLGTYLMPNILRKFEWGHPSGAPDAA